MNEDGTMDYPKLRPVEAIATQDNMICLRDPLGFSDKLIFLPQDLFFIVTLFDGKHSILDIQAAYTRRFGNLLFSDKVREIIESLDRCLFLENKHFQEVKDRVIEDFKKLAIRPTSHAGISYEKDKEALRKELGSLFDASDSARISAEESQPGRMCGLIAPHIDIHRGGACFALSYAELFRQCGARTYVILGIAHAQTQRRFVLTTKDFETPLGVISTDRDFIRELSKKCTINFFEDEFVHRNEHSIEFQAVFLKYLFANNSEVQIVPILCSSFTRDYLGGSLGEDVEFNEFTNALKGVFVKKGEEACVIAGVDLSHLGQRFGQNLNMTPAILQWAKEEDMKMIGRILDRDSEGFFRVIQEEKDSRNVCGVPAIYTLLKLMDAKSARLLKYDQSVDSKTQSVVTFMSASFYT